MSEADSRLTVTSVGEPRGHFPEATHVRFITEGRLVDCDEIEAAVRAVEGDTCTVISYDSETRVGFYAVVDEDPEVAPGQVVPIAAIAPLDATQLRHAYDAGAALRELHKKSKGEYWPAWWDYQRNNPVAEARSATQCRYFHGGYHGHPYSAELAKHPLDRKKAV